MPPVELAKYPALTQSLLPIWIPSRDNRIDIGTSQMLASISLDVFNTFGKPMQIFSANASNIPRARNAALHGTPIESAEIWGLWVDDDMIITIDLYPYFHAFVEYALRLPKRHIVVVNYRTAIPEENFRPQVMRHRVMPGADNEIFVPQDGMPRFFSLGTQGVSGFGLAAGWWPKSYVFHADEWGEDCYFWADHPDWELIVDTGWMPGHKKEVIL